MKTFQFGKHSIAPHAPTLPAGSEYHLPEVPIERIRLQEILQSYVHTVTPIVSALRRNIDSLRSRVRPAGHMAIHKKVKDRKTEKTYKNRQLRFTFDVNKCKVCKHATECGYKGTNPHIGKQYSISILSEQQEDLKRRQETEEFKAKYRERYIVEAKNSELKHPYHLDRAISYGLDAFSMQSAIAIFTSNLVRINRILADKSEK